MRRALELFAAALLGGAVVLAGSHGWLAGSASRGADVVRVTTSEGRAGAASDAQISAEELRSALEREATQRETLAAELELMRTVVEYLAAAQAEAAEAADLASSADTANAAKLAAQAKTAKPAGLQFEDERLAELGMLEDEIADLRRLWDGAQLAKLELNDRATREGWLMRPGHRNQAAQIERDLRDRLGEEAYDKLLYATNQLNRTEVKQVLGGSAAARAGLQPGDHLLSYGGVRIFKPADLRTATSAGTRGEPVRVIVDREGSTFSIVVERGPLGILMNAMSSPPR